MKKLTEKKKNWKIFSKKALSVYEGGGGVKKKIFSTFSKKKLSHFFFGDFFMGLGDGFKLFFFYGP